MQIPANEIKKRFGSGLGIDSHGGPVVDPTENVIALVKADGKRQDDLRNANDKYHEAMRSSQDKANAREIDHVATVSNLRAEHARDLADKESRRVDAVRQVDQLAVTRAAEQTLAAVTTLATTTGRDAETLRNLVTTTAAAVAAQNATIVQGLTERISALEKTSYVGAGKEQYVDPMMKEMVVQMTRLNDRENRSFGKVEGIGSSWGVLLGAAALFLALIGIWNGLKVSAPPTIYYTPTPAGTMQPIK